MEAEDDEENVAETAVGCPGEEQTGGSDPSGLQGGGIRAGRLRPWVHRCPWLRRLRPIHAIVGGAVIIAVAALRDVSAELRPRTPPNEFGV